MDSLFLQSVEGLRESPPASRCAISECGEPEKESVAREILSAGSLSHCELDGMQESEASEEYRREVELRGVKLVYSQ